MCGVLDRRLYSREAGRAGGKASIWYSVVRYASNHTHTHILNILCIVSFPSYNVIGTVFRY